MRGVKKESLKLIMTWVACTQQRDVVAQYYLPPLLEAVLIDYKNNVPDAREPEVLSLMTIMTERLDQLMAVHMAQIFDALFECTLDMIKENFEDYPEHRKNFFMFLQAVNKHCFAGLITIPLGKFRLFIDAIVWAFRHHVRDVAEIGLAILYELFSNMSGNEQQQNPLASAASAQVDAQGAQSFYQAYYMEILNHVFSVACDVSNSARKCQL